MPPETRTTQSELIINFLKSADFEDILKSTVKKETEALLKEIEELRTEVVNLKNSNIDLIRLLTSTADQGKVSIINRNNDNTKPANALLLNKKENLIKTTQDNQSREERNTEKKSTEEIAEKQTTISKGDHTLEEDTHEKWEFPRRKKFTRTRPIYGKAIEETPFKGVTKYIDYHVYRLPPKFTEEDVMNYLRSKGIHDIKCQKMVSRYPDEYSSFKISVSLKLDRAFRNPQIWPEFCVINRFLQRLPEKNKKS